MNKKKVLQDAAFLIHKNGFCRFQFHYGNRFCARGAINEIMSGPRSMTLLGDDDAVTLQAFNDFEASSRYEIASILLSLSEECR